MHRRARRSAQPLGVMNRRPKLQAMAALILAAAVAYATGSVSWQNRVYLPVEGKSAIPDPIRAYLKMDQVGLHGVAEAEEPFNASDLVTDSTLPFRRLVGVGRGGEYWLVVLDHGGFSRVFEAYLFRGSRLEKRWKHFWRPQQTFASIMASDEWWVPQ